MLFFSCLSEFGLLIVTWGLKGDGSMFDFTQDALRNNDDAEHMARIGDILIDTYDDIENMGKDQRHFSWIPTGFADLDSTVGNYAPCEGTGIFLCDYRWHDKKQYAA